MSPCAVQAAAVVGIPRDYVLTSPCTETQAHAHAYVVRSCGTFRSVVGFSRVFPFFFFYYVRTHSPSGFWPPSAPFILFRFFRAPKEEEKSLIKEASSVAAAVAERRQDAQTNAQTHARAEKKLAAVAHVVRSRIGRLQRTSGTKAANGEGRMLSFGPRRRRR